MARTMRFSGVVWLFAGSIPLFAQQRVDQRNMYERVLAVVPLIGSGTSADPKRPTYAPTPSAIDSTSRSGILAFTHVVSDDGNFALVEFVAKDRSAFKDILADNSIRAFLKGRDRIEDALAVFKTHKKDFDFVHFGVRMP